MAWDPKQLRADYEERGYAFPLTVMSAEEAAGYRATLEEIERGEADASFLNDALWGLPHLLFPFLSEIMRRPEVLDPVAALLGPDLLLWNCSFFTKEPRSPDRVTWHQDLTYWGLDDAQEVTAWIALSPATVESGAMRFIPGTHKQAIVPHRDTFAATNQLSRGQEIAVEVDESQAIDVVLEPGQMSLHHGRLFHASHANGSEDRRIGLALRYITPDMRQVVGRKDYAMLVRGEDRFGHFELLDPPKGDYHPDDLARIKQVTEHEEEYFYADAAQRGHHRLEVDS